LSHIQGQSSHVGETVKKSPVNPEMVDTLLAAESHDVLDSDEEWSFVKRRPDKRWSWIAPCRRTRQGVAYVIGDRSEKSRRTLWDAIPECCQHVYGHSDFWAAYSPKKRIVASVKPLDKPIMSNEGTTRFANDHLAIPAKPCLFQSPMNAMPGSGISLSENIT
jgi:IS1 family transposase